MSNLIPKVITFSLFFSFPTVINIFSCSSSSVIIIIIIIHSLELFTLALADGFSLESERQQVSSSLQDNS